MRVLVVDDDHLMRAGLVELLSVDPDVIVVGQASTGVEAVAAARRLNPDIVLMDVQMPDMDGIEATQRIVASGTAARIIVLTTFEQDDYVFGALRAGASAFLLKRTRPEELIAALRTIAAGDSLLSPSVTRTVIDRLARQPLPDYGNPTAVDHLTAREREVFQLMAQGLSNREIADLLVIEESTVRTHAKRVLAKLGLRDRIQAVIYSYENGLNTPR